MAYVLDQLPTRADLIPKDPAPVLIKSMTWQVSMLTLTVLLAATVFAYAINKWRKTGRSQMFWITLGALAAFFYEPLGDYMVDIVYHRSGALTALTGFGGTIPLWTMFMYAVFWGPAILFLTNQLETGITMKRWMGLFALSIPFTLFFEVPMLQLGLYQYFGSQQPIAVFGYPLWMAFSNTAAIFVVALLVHAAMKTELVRERPVYLTLLVPSFIIGVGVTTIVPIGLGMSSTTSLTIINLCAVASSVLSIAYAWVGFKMVAPSAPTEPAAEKDKAAAVTA
jgi:hypothetical protein